MSEAVVARSEQAGWLELTINRPAAMNALNAEVLDELTAAVAELRARDDLRGMIITGAGEKAFVAGADITGLPGLGPAEAVAFARHGQGILDAIERGGKPVIAAVNGFALGGGCELALACHIRLLAKTARMGLPEVSLGVIPGYGGTQRLARLVGTGRALQMILTGDPVDAEEAYRIGLANLVVEPADLLAASRNLASRITSRGPRAVSLALEAVLGGRDRELPEALAWEAESFGLAAATEDWSEGTRAFLEKRKPAFRGR
jgi:enoyl-CoA hydratase/carnithine racemase